MQAAPRTESQSRVSFMARIIFSQNSMKVLPVALIPNTSLICDVRIIRAAADVNPEDTGPDMKSITNPVDKESKHLCSLELDLYFLHTRWIGI